MTPRTWHLCVACVFVTAGAAAIAASAPAAAVLFGAGAAVAAASAKWACVETPQER